MKKLLCLLSLNACAVQQLPPPQIADFKLEPLEVVYMDSKCEDVPRLCFEECGRGILSSCYPQKENMVVLYR